MAVLATDNFNRANETPLSGGGNWSAGVDNTWNLSSNVAVPASAAADSVMHYTGATWPNDQYSKAALTVSSTGGSDQGVGLCVRSSTVAQTMYRVVADHAASLNVTLDKLVAGTWTPISTITQAWTDGDTWELDVQSTTLTVKLNGSTIITQTDSSIASGVPGIALSSSVTSASLDNWEGGDFSAGGGGGKPQNLMLLGVGGMVRLLAVARLNEPIGKRTLAKLLAALLRGPK